MPGYMNPCRNCGNSRSGQHPGIVQNYVIALQNYVTLMQNYVIPLQNYVIPLQNYVKPHKTVEILDQSHDFPRKS